MKIKTSTGFECSVIESKIKDYRFLRAARAMDSKDPGKNVDGLISMAELLLTPDGVERLLEHVQDEDGTASAERVAQEIGEIISALAEKNKTAKNS